MCKRHRGRSGEHLVYWSQSPAVCQAIVPHYRSPAAQGMWDTEHREISSLVVLQLLALVGHDDQLNSPKYKCAVSFDFIRAIAR
ncbi:UNVERIFIED_CONTAM: hypothetical protein FKN15_009530 [Acipenser sinensis]